LRMAPRREECLIRFTNSATSRRGRVARFWRVLAAAAALVVVACSQPLAPQPSEGDGWRLLADEHSGARRQVGLAADAAILAELWAEIGLDAPVPEVDFGKHVVISFGVSYSGSCPDIRLDDVVVDGAVVYPEIVNLSREVACTSDLNPHAYVVALERSRLPSGPFAIQLEAETPSHARPMERLLVDADLSASGAVPDPGAVEVDGSLARSVRSGDHHVDPWETWSYRLDTRCGIEWLGEVNDVAWRTDEPMPEEWKSAVEAPGALEVLLEVEVEPESLIRARVNGKTVLYKPTEGEIPECDQP